jgi:proteasome lid subunit RPN8/RPN11
MFVLFLIHIIDRYRYGTSKGTAMEKELIRRAVILFPHTHYTDPTAVRHARRQWLRTVSMLHSAPGGSRWILDQPTTRH